MTEFVDLVEVLVECLLFFRRGFLGFYLDEELRNFMRERVGIYGFGLWFMG